MAQQNEKPAAPERPPREESAPAQEAAAQEAAAPQEKDKRPRNIVTDFYDSLNVSVRTLDIALVVLCAFILLVIVFASKKGL